MVESIAPDQSAAVTLIEPVTILNYRVKDLYLSIADISLTAVVRLSCILLVDLPNAL
jgi:hypothetical protein